MSMLYHAMMLFGVNEVGPVQTIEIVTAIALMTLSAIANAYIFGEMAMLVQQMDQKDMDYQERLDNANTAMSNLQIPDHVQDNIREYLVVVNDNMIFNSEVKDFMDDLSPSLKNSVAQYILFVAI